MSASLPRLGRWAPQHLWLLFLTGLAIGLRFQGLDRQALWVDEAFSVKYAALWGALRLEQLLENLHGPLHAALLHFWAACFGRSEFALRSLQAVIGAGTVPALYWALRPATSMSVALSAAGLLSVSPFHLWYSQEIRNYALAILFAVLSIGFLVRWLATGRSAARNLLGYTLTNVAGLLSNLSHSFLLIGQGTLFFLGTVSIRRRWRGLILSWVAVALSLAPWIMDFWQRQVVPSGALELTTVADGERLRGDTSAPLWGVPYTYASFSYGFSLGPSLRELHGSITPDLFRKDLFWLAWSALAFGSVFLLGLYKLWRRSGMGRGLCLLALLPVLLTYAVSLRNVKVFNPRYAAAAFPAYLVVLAEGVHAPRRRWARAGLAAALLIPSGVSLARYTTDSGYWKEDARGATRFLREEMRAGDGLFVIGTDEPLQQYYWRGIRDGEDGIAKADAQEWRGLDASGQVARWRVFRREHTRLYVLWLRPEFVDPAGVWPARIEADAGAIRKREFPGASVWVLEGPGR